MFDMEESYGIKKMRNRLSPEQRIDVIRRYENKTSVRELARIFNCGRTQIKGILRNRNHHLMLGTQAKTENSMPKAPPRSRPPRPPPSPKTQPISFVWVELVLAEWVRRARCYHINITPEILRNFAQEIADHMNLKGFQVNEKWLQQFRQKYHLSDTELSIKQEVDGRPNERKPLSISVIIEDMRHQNGAAGCGQSAGEHCYSGGEDSELDDGMFQNVVPEITIITQEDESVGQMEDEEPIHYGYGPIQGDDIEPAKLITDYRQALNHLGPLEQFVLLRENVRAVGLINQLETLLREEMLKEE